MTVFGLPELGWIELFVLLVTSYIIWWVYTAQFFKRQGIPGPFPIPPFGTFASAFKKGINVHMAEMKEKYGDIYGEFVGSQPMLSTTDLDIIKEVFIKENKAFPTRMTLPNGNKYAQMMLTNITDYDNWKRMRSLMSPTFSSGKLNKMTVHINHCARQCVRHMINHCSKHTSMEAQEFAGSFTMDVIASTAFGLDINAKADHNNDFVKMARKGFTIERFHPTILGFFFPSLRPIIRWLGFSIFDKEVIKFFCKATVQTLMERDAAKDTRVDFLTLMQRAHRDDHSADREELMETEGDILQDKPTKGMSLDEIVSQGFLFFMVGYETTAVSISFMAYNLATNPKCQDKLREEIAKVMQDKDDDADFTPEDLHEMQYLDQCVLENLRLYPALMRTDRVASQPTVVKGIHIPAGGIVQCPIWTIHRDPRYYPDPDAFKPERFSAEEKATRPALSFLAFGAGARQCLATRLAMLEVKVVIVHMLRHHRLVTTEDTQIPLKLSKRGLTKSEKGIYLRLEACTV